MSDTKALASVVHSAVRADHPDAERALVCLTGLLRAARLVGALQDQGVARWAGYDRALAELEAEDSYQ